MDGSPGSKRAAGPRRRMVRAARRPHEAPGAARLPAAFACLLLLGASRAEATVTILSFSLQPAAPDTGDPVVLTATIQSTSSCDFLGASIAYGPQSELGGQQGWGIDVDFMDGVLPVVSTCPIEADFGTLVVASGDGVVRARNYGVVNDTAFFALSVAPFQDQDLPAGLGEVPGAGRPYRAAAHHDHVV